MHPPCRALAAIVGWAFPSPRADTPSPRCDRRPGQKVPGACSEEEAPAGLGSSLHRLPAPLGCPRPTRLPGTRSQPRARAHAPSRTPAADARPRARVRLSERPREPSQSERRAGRAGVKRRRRPRLRATDPGAASSPALLLGDFVFVISPKSINLENLAFFLMALALGQRALFSASRWALPFPSWAPVVV